MARQQRVFIDTSELFPFTIMDVLLSLSEDFLFTWVWTDELLNEWEHVIVRERRSTPESAASVASAVRAHFAQHRINPATYRDKITDDLSHDPSDRAHAAAAIHGDVDVLLTRNLKHLRTDAVLAAGVRVSTADDFLCDLLADRRQGVVESFARAADSRKSPPVTRDEFAQAIAAAGAPRFADRIRSHLTRRRDAQT